MYDSTLVALLFFIIGIFAPVTIQYLREGRNR